MVLDQTCEDVQGLLFSSDALAEHLPRLDVFEGSGYERAQAWARLDDGIVDADIYALTGNRALPRSVRNAAEAAGRSLVTQFDNGPDAVVEQ